MNFGKSVNQNDNGGPPLNLQRDWHAMSAQEVENYLVSSKQGLSKREASKRLRTYGYNAIEKRGKPSFLNIFATQFRDPMVLLLLLATVVSGIMGEMIDASVILLIVLLNAVLGSMQEYRAEKSLEALENYAPPNATVLRDGTVLEVPRESVVPGDVLILRPGMRVAADARLTVSKSLQCEEAALSGESLPSSKEAETSLLSNTSLAERKNMVYAGTLVTRGEGEGIVVATGMNTEMGRIAKLVSSASSQPTPLERKLESLGSIIIAGCLGICAVLVVAGVLQGMPIHRMILVGVSLAVAAVPEGLPAVVTLCFAIGVQRMAKRNCIVRKLESIETLGSVTVICTDKTGTLTQNEMKVYDIGLPETVSKGAGGKISQTRAQDILKAALLASDARHFSLKDGSAGEDPTEQAIVKEAIDLGIDVYFLDESFPRIHERPFSPERRMMSVKVRSGAVSVVFAKGAPDTLIPLCKDQRVKNSRLPLTPLDKEKWQRWVDVQASEGRRVLAVAMKEEMSSTSSEYTENGFSLLGCLAMEDPLRPFAKESVETCIGAGIKPILITGDHLKTAESIGSRSGILSKAGSGITGDRLERLSLRETAVICQRHPVLARISPIQKLKVVKALKGASHVVAMTGDGVNDAPALKEAAVGIAMGKTGTDVAREASSIVILDDDFRSIVAAVEEGRAIYDNIRKFIRYLFSCNLGEVITVGIATIAGLPMPLTPTQLLWVNLVTDGLPALALSMDRPMDDVMKRPPRDPKEGVFSGGLSKLIFTRGIYIGLVTLLVFLSRIHTSDFAKASTLAYATLVTSQLVTAFDCRSEQHSITELGIFGNIYLVGACLISWLMLYATIHMPFLSSLFRTVPLGVSEWILVFFASIFPDVAREAFSSKKHSRLT